MYQLTNTDKKVIAQLAIDFNLNIDLPTDSDTLVEVNYTHTVDRLDDGQFLVCQVSVIPGVRYHADGSGTPDDVDVTELGTFPRFNEALASAVSLAMHQAVFQIVECVREEEEFADRVVEEF